MKAQKNVNSNQKFVVEQSVVDLLSKFLANTYVLYVKTQNFHWNIVGDGFYFLHKMLEEQYEELAEVADEIAERLRALDRHAPGTMKDFLRLSTLKEAEERKYSAMEMIRILANDHQTISKDLRDWIPETTKHDEGTADLFIQRLRAHDKTAWMLKSHLEKS